MLPSFKPPNGGPPDVCCAQDFKYETLMLERSWDVWSVCWHCGKRWEWDGMTRLWHQKAKAKADG